MAISLPSLFPWQFFMIYQCFLQRRCLEDCWKSSKRFDAFVLKITFLRSGPHLEPRTSARTSHVDSGFWRSARRHNAVSAPEPKLVSKSTEKLGETANIKQQARWRMAISVDFMLYSGKPWKKQTPFSAVSALSPCERGRFFRTFQHSGKLLQKRGTA